MRNSTSDAAESSTGSGFAAGLVSRFGSSFIEVLVLLTL